MQLGDQLRLKGLRNVVDVISAKDKETDESETDPAEPGLTRGESSFGSEAGGYLKVLEFVVPLLHQFIKIYFKFTAKRLK